MNKSQSAMEYLMTYGWSILIVAVVLGALSFLGIFNPLTFTPKAQPGSCQVIKNTELGVSNFVGSCNNQVPQYVAKFNGSNYFILNNFVPQEGASQYTVSMWAYLTNSSQQDLVVEYTQTVTASGCSTYSIAANPITINAWNQNYGPNWYTSNSDISVPLNSWNMITITLSGGGTGTGTMDVYVNGALSANIVGQEMLHTDIGNPITEIGGGSTGCLGNLKGSLEGKIANMQMYNSTLDSNAISMLYSEGIGGAPVDMQSLVGWWPLNGDVNDYSGNNYNGAATNLAYISSWFGGYTQP